MEDKNPTPPAKSASEAQPTEGGETGGGTPSVNELLSAARGDVTRERVSARERERTPVTPAAKAASSNTVADAAPAGDAPGKSVPSGTPTAARVSPSTGASKTTSTPTAAVNKGVSRAVAAKPPAGPLVESTEEPPVNKLRRRIVWASVASFLGVSFLMFLRFFLPRTLMEPSNVFSIGYPGDYGIGVDTKWQQLYRIWVVKNSERLFIITAVCTHLGCTPDWKSSENKFKCPCHGSGYDSEGVNFEGPAPRPMDRAQISLDAEGQIVVNKDRLFKWEKGKQSEFDDEKNGAYIRV